MDAENGNTDGRNGKRNGNFESDRTKEELVLSDTSLEIPIPTARLSEESRENGETTTTIQAVLSTPSTTESVTDKLPANSFSFMSLSETKTTKREGAAILEVAEQTTAYNVNVQLSSDNPATIETIQAGQGDGSMIVIDQPDQVIIQENIKVKDSSKVQIGQNNVISSALTDNSQGSALVGATAAAVSPPQLVIRKPKKVLLYSKKDLDSCDRVQIGDNNIMGKLIPQEDEFVKACIKLGINPKQKKDIFEKLGDEQIREQFATMMEEKCNVHCKLKNAGDGCILLELEVPTEADRLQLLRMARDGTFQQVLLETFLPEFAAEGRAVIMNLAIGVRNPSQAMVEELQGATASSGHEDVVVVEIPAATNDPSTSKQDQPAEHSLKKSDDMDGAAKEEDPSADIDVTTSKPAFYTEDVTTPSKKLLSDPDDGEGEITVSVEGYAEAAALGTGATAANFPPEGFDDKFLTCDICQNIYEDPRVLPCGHTFCARCLEKWRKRKNESDFSCPKCRRKVSLQGKGISSLSPNFHIKDLLDYRASQNVKEAYAQCQMCESGAKIEGYCEECHLFLCKNCITGHRKSPALKDHRITRLDKTTKFCSKHTDQPITFYCQPCAKLVCQDCAENEHQPGQYMYHDLQEVRKVAEESKVALQTLVGEMETKLKGTGYIIEKELTWARTNYDPQKKKIQEHFAQLRAKLEEEEQEMTNKLKKMNDELQNSLLEERKNLEETLKLTEGRLQFCRDVLTGGSDVQIVRLKKQLEDNLNHLNTEEIPNRRLGHEIVLSMRSNMKTFKCSPGYLDKHRIKYKTIELPTESLATTIILDASFPTQRQYPKSKSGAAFQVTVIPDTFYMSGIPNHLPEEQCAILDTTRISENVFEAAWRPQTSGKHLVGVTESRGESWRIFNQGSLFTVDVSSNNPVLRFGQKGSQQGQFDRPVGVAVRGDRLYVADTGNQRVQVFDLSGNFCFSFLTTAYPEFVAIQTDGTIVVKSGQEVMKFSPSGELLHKFPLDKYCTDPYDIAVQSNGRVVVADRDKHSIFLFEADGTLVKQMGVQGQGDEGDDLDTEEEEDLDEEEGEKDLDDEEEEEKEGVGQFDKPCFVCVDGEDNIIVSDFNNHRVQLFDKNMNFRHIFGQRGRQPQDMWHPMGVSADSRRNIVLANLGVKSGSVEHSQKLQVFCPEGTWVSTISSDGDKLKRPHGVAVTEDGHVFVADTKDHCIRKYRYT